MRILFLFFMLLPIAIFSQKNESDYSLTNPTFLDSTISNYNIVFSSEIHWSKQNLKRRENLISYLANKNSLNKIVLEIGFIYGFWINKYMETGDTIFFKEFTDAYGFMNSAGDDTNYTNTYNYYVKLRHLLKGKQVEFVGIDLEFAHTHPKSTLWSFIQLTKHYPQLKIYAESTKKASMLLLQNKVKGNDLKKWFLRLKKELKKEKISNDVFSRFIKNIDESIDFPVLRGFIYREKIMYQNFLDMIDKSDKVYGQFGLSHIMLNNRKEMTKNRLATYLNQNQLFKDKILSIGLVCYDCQSADLPIETYYEPFLIKDEFERLTPKFKKLPSNTFVDLRKTDEKIKEFVQLLLIVHE